VPLNGLGEDLADLVRRGWTIEALTYPWTVAYQDEPMVKIDAINTRTMN
jgi:hypothetical protein